MGKTAGINLGLDFTILGQGLTGSVEYYSTTTKDLLYDVALPDITGFPRLLLILENQNKGFEFILTSKNIQTSDLNGLPHSIFDKLQ